MLSAKCWERSPLCCKKTSSSYLDWIYANFDFSEDNRVLDMEQNSNFWYICASHYLTIKDSNIMLSLKCWEKYILWVTTEKTFLLTFTKSSVIKFILIKYQWFTNEKWKSTKKCNFAWGQWPRWWCHQTKNDFVQKCSKSFFNPTKWLNWVLAAILVCHTWHFWNFS